MSPTVVFPSTLFVVSASQKNAHIGMRLPAGFAAGASGAAAGIVEPFTPRGRLLWRGEEAMAAALELAAAAEQAAARSGPQDPDEEERFVWRQELLRLAGKARTVGQLAPAITALLTFEM